MGALGLPAMRPQPELEGGVMAVDKATMRRARRRDCEYCGCDRVVLRRTVASNGANMYFWLCAECQDHARRKNQWLSHAVINTWVELGKFDSPEDIPIHVEYQSSRRCEVCGRAGAEYHHWAPKSLAKYFGDDWHEWPGSFLCKTHHDMWHEIVTPLMHGRRGTERAQQVLEAMGVNGNGQ